MTQPVEVDIPHKLGREGVRQRIDGGISVRVHPAFLYGAHPLASVGGPFNAVTVESSAITEITLSGPGAGGPQTASAVLGDVVSTLSSPAPTPPPRSPTRCASRASSSRRPRPPSAGCSTTAPTPSRCACTPWSPDWCC